jgi:hypothetical protein
MQKYIFFPSILVAFFMSGNSMSMQIPKKLSGKKCYPKAFVMHIFNNKTYYAGLGDEPKPQSTFIFRDLCRIVAQSEKRIKELEKYPLPDLSNATQVEDALRRRYEIKMLRGLMERNRHALREQLDTFCKPPKKVMSRE